MIDGQSRDPTLRLLAPRFRALTVGISLAVSLAGFEALGVTTAMPAASDALRGDSLYGWSFSAFQLASMVATVVAGAMADRVGPARPLAAALVLFAAGLALGAGAPTMPILVLSRAIAGLGAGAIFNLNNVLIGRVYPDELRSRMLAVGSAAWIVPGLVGPFFSGIITDRFGWRWVFGGLLPAVPAIAALVLPVVGRLGGEGRPSFEATGERFWDAAPAQRVRAGIVLAGAAAAVLAGLSSAQPVLLAALVLGGSCLALPPARTLLPAGTARARSGLPATTLGFFLLMGAFVGTESFLPLALERTRDVSSTMAGLILTAGTLTWTLGSWLQSRHPDRWMHPARLGPAALLLAAGIVAAATITFGDVPGAVGYAGWAAGGVGMGIAFNSLGALTFRLVDVERVGVATGATGLASALGSAMAAGIGGALVNAGDRRFGESSPVGLRLLFAFQATLALGTAAAVLRALPGRAPRGSRSGAARS